MSILNTLRGPKIYGIAAFDVISTVIAATILSKTLDVNIFITHIALFVIAILVHMFLGIPTMGNYYLGLNSFDSVIEAREGKKEFIL